MQTNTSNMQIAHLNISKLELGELKKVFLSLFLIYAVGISAILRANYNYIDDQGRVAYGYQEWEGFGRYLSNFLSNFLHADPYLTDISPLPQLIAAGTMALAGLVIYHLVLETKSFWWAGIIALIPLGLSPYFLECFSYKYDAPYMALSVLFSVVPLLVWQYSTRLYLIASILSILGVCLTYQASSGIFPMFVVLLCLKRWNAKTNKKTIITFLLYSVIGFLSGMVIYKVFIMPPADAYVSNSLPDLPELLPVAFEHLKQYYQKVIEDFKKEWIVLILLLVCCFIESMVLSSKQGKIIALFISLIAVCFMCMLAFGAYVVIEKPLFEPRAMYGFGILIALLNIGAISEKTWTSKLICAILGWIFFVFSFTYGNALSAQKDYENFRIEAVVMDLSELDVMANDTAKQVQIVGSVGLAPILRNMPQDYNMLNRLIPIQFREKWIWGCYQWRHYYGLKNVNVNLNTDLKDAHLPILKESAYHTIRGDAHNILIEVRE